MKLINDKINQMKLMNDNCIEAMKTIKAQSVDMILCDLPYGTTDCKWDIVIDFDLLWEQYKRIIKPHGAIVLFGTEPFSSRLRLSNLKWYRYDWYWEKDRGVNFLFSNKQPLKVTETISVFYKHQPTYNPQKTKGKAERDPNKTYWYGENASAKQIMKNRPATAKHSEHYEPDKRLPRQILYFPRDTDRIHPTQKPIALLEYLIRTYTNRHEIVLDNTMGSGSCGVACYNTNRAFIGIEQDKTIYQNACAFIERRTQQLQFEFVE